MATPGAREARPLSTALEAAIVAGSAAVFAGVSWFKALRVPYPVFDDVEFLDFGVRIHAAGGPWTVLRGLFTGDFKESNRHPLYLALIAILGRPDPAFHRDAQVLAVALGVLALLACWYVARRHLGPLPAALVAVMLAGNGALVWTACRECPDALLVAFWALSVGALLDGAAEDSARARRAWALAGVWAGLAYETKGPGLFMPICLGLALLARERLAAIKNVRAWCFAGGFALLAAPLWWRNVRVYGSPTYNSNGRLFWIDGLPDFAEIFAPNADARIPHGPAEWLAHTTPWHVVKRFGLGFFETVFHLGDALAPVAPRVGGVLHVLWVVFGVVGAAASVQILVRFRPTAEDGPTASFARTFALAQWAFWFPFLVFYNAVSGASRYFLPLAATAVVPAVASWLARRSTRDLRGLERWLGGAVAVSGFAVVTTLALDASPTTAPPGFLEAQAWIVDHTRGGLTYAVDARTHFQPRWLVPDAKQLIVSASWATAPVPVEEERAYLCANHVRFIVLDGASRTSGVEEGSSASRYLFYDRLPLAADGSLPRTGFPEGTRPVYFGAETPLRWVILELSCPDGASNAL